MKEDLLFDLLKEKDDFSNLYYYIGTLQNSKMELSISIIIDQINQEINQIAKELFSMRPFRNK
ncbi:MAG: hypothetical protein ACFFDK_02915 [Promethearchaeota archaeon]